MDSNENNNSGDLLTIQRGHAPETPVPPRPAEPEKNAPAQVVYVPELSGRFRELHRFLERERASAQSAISSKEYFLVELRTNLRELEQISDDLENLSGPGLRSEKERNALLDKLYLRYYRTSGTIAGLGEKESIAAVSSASSAVPKTFGTLFFENLPSLIGTLLGAAVIAVVIAAVFG